MGKKGSKLISADTLSELKTLIATGDTAKALKTIAAVEAKPYLTQIDYYADRLTETIKKGQEYFLLDKLTYQENQYDCFVGNDYIFGFAKVIQNTTGKSVGKFRGDE